MQLSALTHTKLSSKEHQPNYKLADKDVLKGGYNVMVQYKTQISADAATRTTLQLESTITKQLQLGYYVSLF